MNEKVWLLSVNPTEMLDCIVDKVSLRKLRLFCANCSLLSEERVLDIYSTWIYGEPDEDDKNNKYMPFIDADNWCRSSTYRDIPLNVRADVFREIIGYPDRHYFLYNDNNITRNQYELREVVKDIANNYYDTLDKSLIPIIADAIEESNSYSEDILQHFKGKILCSKCLGEKQTKEVMSLTCPKCKRRGYRRKGVHFDHELRCGECDISWEPNKEETFICYTCDGVGYVDNTFKSHLRGCWALDIILGLD
jgi:hypothetical protein